MVMHAHDAAVPSQILQGHLFWILVFIQHDLHLGQRLNCESMTKLEDDATVVPAGEHPVLSAGVRHDR